ncbi:MAG: sigma-70 family RNA polymerase sigma factor [Planctomycetaceae bacterium]|nr:sigma-70 family RNA polymerase sigma factor [Planctomycetaceae bacterium]
MREFQNLLERVRHGDTAAFAVLVEQYGPAIRREVRFRVLDGKLKRQIEESDILQSVLLRLWLGIWAGELEIDTPEGLYRLLQTMTRNRIVDAVRHWTAECRDVRVQRPINLNLAEASDDRPSQILEVTETLELLRRTMPERERRILEARQAGRDWDSIAQDLGDGAPSDSVRRQHQRVVMRLLANFGWGD